MAGKETKSFSLDPGVKEYADQLDNASKTVNELLKSYKKSGGGRELAALELRLKHKRKELKRAENKATDIRQDVKEIEALIDELTEEKPTIEEAQKALENTPKDPGNPAIKNWATEMGVSPNRLVEHLETGEPIQ